jgi:hypothetical protein
MEVREVLQHLVLEQQNIAEEILLFRFFTLMLEVLAADRLR